jgi:hypothetical protein
VPPQRLADGGPHFLRRIGRCGDPESGLDRIGRGQEVPLAAQEHRTAGDEIFLDGAQPNPGRDHEQNQRAFAQATTSLDRIDVDDTGGGPIARGVHQLVQEAREHDRLANGIASQSRHGTSQRTLAK